MDEETGLTGAAGLEPGFVDSKTLMNLDSEEEGALYVGCSGGRDTIGTWKVNFEKVPAKHVAVQRARCRIERRPFRTGDR